MEYSSAGFEEQAASDLRQAQKIARSDWSGQALATAMYLAQQSMEKQLKSIVLRLDEALKIGLGATFYKKSLGHTVYSRPKELYLNCIKGIGFPRGLDDRNAMEAALPGFYEEAKAGYDYLEKFGETWKREFFDVRTQELLLRHSLRARLSDAELQELDKYAHKTLEKIYKDSGFVVLVPRFANEEPRTKIDSVVSDERLLEKHRGAYRRSDHLVVEFSNNENLFMMCSSKIKKSRERLEASEITSEAVKRLARIEIVEYAIPSLAGFSKPYLRIYPHFELGRYPGKLCDGKVTTDIYASQHNDVLYELFVVANYNQTRISYVNKHIDNFCLIYNKIC